MSTRILNDVTITGDSVTLDGTPIDYAIGDEITVEQLTLTLSVVTIRVYTEHLTVDDDLDVITTTTQTYRPRHAQTIADFGLDSLAH